MGGEDGSCQVRCAHYREDGVGGEDGSCTRLGVLATGERCVCVCVCRVCVCAGGGPTQLCALQCPMTHENMTWPVMGGAIAMWQAIKEYL